MKVLSFAYSIYCTYKIESRKWWKNQNESRPNTLLTLFMQFIQAFWILVEDVDSEVILHHEYFLLKR